MTPLRVGLIGFGTVGRSLAWLLRDQAQAIERRAGRPVLLAAVADKDPARRREAKRLGRAVADARRLLDDPSLDAIVELVGGIEPARTFVLEALSRGKDVVTANKKLLADHGPEIVEAAARAHRSVGFEASVCGGLPVIGALRGGLAASRFDEIAGVVNGTTNQILQWMEGGLSFEAALAEAQELGIAERDPANDVDGFDAAHKLAILATIAFGMSFPVSSVDRTGIRDLPVSVLVAATRRGFSARLLARARRIDRGVRLSVRPTLLPAGHPLGRLQGVQNGLLVRGDPMGEQFFSGPGAGGPPTAGAVAADLVDLATGEARAAFGRIVRSALGGAPPALGPDADEPVRHLVFGGGPSGAEALRRLGIDTVPEDGLHRTGPALPEAVSKAAAAAARECGPLWALPIWGPG